LVTASTLAAATGWPARPRRGPARLLRALTVLGAAFPWLYFLAVRPWHRRWGATDDELLMALPGDELVPEPGYQHTRAVTIQAPAGAVWPWLAQIGQGRGGFYSYDWLENLAGCDIHSADRVHPEWQDVKPGDALAIMRGWGTKLAAVEPGRALVIQGWGTYAVRPIDAHTSRLTARALALRPDVVLMDIKMPRLGGLEATRRIKAALPAATIVMLTVSDDEEDLFEAIKAGAEGYLLKNMSGTEFSQMLAGLARGEPPVSRSLAGKLLHEFGRRIRGEATTHDPAELTQREKDVLQLVVRGATNKDVARRLVIRENTVNFHMKNILGKLHAHTRAEAAVRALQEGLVPPEPEGER
jgi:DNA-binding NarL/FixJ family response regulator